MTVTQLQLGDNVKLLLDVTSITALLGVLAAILPVIASALTVGWMGYRLWDEIKKHHFTKDE